MMDLASPARHLTLLLLTATSIIAAPDLSICDPSNYTYPYNGPTLPKLPQQYHLTVEASIANKNYSMMLEEFYDEINNRGASVAPYGNSVYHTSYDYRLNQTVMVMIDNVNGNASCQVSDLPASRFNLFGFHMENGSGHINGSDAIFRFGKEFNETYIGRTTVRGIPANQWQRCVYHQDTNKTYLLDFYFSDPIFKLPYGASQIPLRATINGSAVNATGHRRMFYHNYEYLEVKPGPVEKERAFEPPLGVHCPGYKRVKKFPPFPEIFSFDVESVFPNRKEIHFLKMSYNYPAKLVSYTYRPRNSTSRSRMDVVREVHDYNIGLSYKLNFMSEECSIGPIPVGMYLGDAYSPDGIHVSLQSPYNFLLHNQTEWIYEGNTTLRDVDAEAWITAGTRTNATHPFNFTMEYIFARGNWTGDGLKNVLVHQMPMRVTFTGRTMNNTSKFQVIQNVYHFSPNILDHDFDVSRCYDERDSRSLAVDVMGVGNYENYVVNNSHTFYAAAQAALANASGLPSTRISDLYAVEGTDDVLTIYFKMLGIPDVKGNAINMSSQPSLVQGMATLEARDVDEIPITINLMKGNRTVHLALFQGSLRMAFHPQDVEESKGLSSGAAAGVSIFMFILGALIASGIAYFYIKRIMAPPVPYGVQD